jgi:hypothetical protein
MESIAIDPQERNPQVSRNRENQDYPTTHLVPG